MSTHYLCLQRSQPGERERPKPEQMQAMYAAFDAWKEKYSANIVDLGGRLVSGKLISSDGVADVGSLTAETTEIIGGFMIIQADSLERAVQVVRECPEVVMPGSSVEVREVRKP